MDSLARQVLGIAAIVIAALGWAEQCSARQAAEALRVNVVAISVRAPDNQEVKTGFGIVVGEQNDRLTIATANHVVRDRVSLAPLGRLQVRFFGLTDTVLEATLLSNYTSNLDIAAIDVPKPPDFSWKRSILAEPQSLKPGDPIWSIGRERQWVIPASPGAFQRLNTSGLIEIEHLAVVEGSSGGPVVSETGLVGMLVADGGDPKIFAIPVETIKNVFSKENWNLPWQLRLALAPGRGTVFRDQCVECPEMVVIAGGTFTMGSQPGIPWPDPSSQPAHRVTIDHDFAVSRYEVTTQQWLACVRSGGCSRDAGGKIDEQTRLPIQFVNWSDAHDFARWLSRETGRKYRLLTEAEWEYSARGERTDTFPWGQTMMANAAVCWDCPGPYMSSQTKSPAPIGRYPPNAFKLYDMIGNVAELVEDCWFDNYRGAPVDGSAWTRDGCTDRVLRGGSYTEPWLNQRIFARSQMQNGLDRSASVGFRVARELGP